MNKQRDLNSENIIQRSNSPQGGPNPEIHGKPTYPPIPPLSDPPPPPPPPKQEPAKDK